MLAISVCLIQYLKDNKVDGGDLIAKRVIISILGRLMCNIEELAKDTTEDQELKKAVVMQATGTVNLIAAELKSTELWDLAIVPVYISAI